ncbi:MAG: hypothetical protein DWQ10_15655 [Calditrichaeota bacterium]|nr:MAG: hypothetical protein DWQ10_15655 [Calditrichota bacterium]
MNEDEKAAVTDILKYLYAHPDAKHTMEGIARYWIFQQRLEENLDVVLAATSYLINEGVLETVKMSDGQVYYRVVRSKLDELSSSKH